MVKDPNNPCFFCNSEIRVIAHENELAYASYDSYPVSNLHCLIIPKRHFRDYFDLTNDELVACNDLIKKINKKDIPINTLSKYDEIILIGSGKGVASVKTVDKIGWKRKNLKKFKFLSKQYESVINKCNYYRF